MHRLRRGRFDVHLEHRRLDSIVNRLVMGVLSAALFVGSASLWSNNVKPLIWDTSVPGAIGCVVAVYLGFHLLRAISKTGNLRDSG
jgi:ubiquinone biosynthesis protein